MTPFAGINKVTSIFGYRTNPRKEFHEGIDVVTVGDDSNAWVIRECTGGVVLNVKEDKERGKYIDVKTSADVFERYQHLHRIDVKVGQKVEQGARLGLAGRTGDSTGVHLHFGVYKNNKAINPSEWLGLPNAVGNYKGNNNKG